MGLHGRLHRGRQAVVDCGRVVRAEEDYGRLEGEEGEDTRRRRLDALLVLRMGHEGVVLVDRMGGFRMDFVGGCLEGVGGAAAGAADRNMGRTHSHSSALDWGHWTSCEGQKHSSSRWKIH